MSRATPDVSSPVTCRLVVVVVVTHGGTPLLRDCGRHVHSAAHVRGRSEDEKTRRRERNCCRPVGQHVRRPQTHTNASDQRANARVMNRNKFRHRIDPQPRRLFYYSVFLTYVSIRWGADTGVTPTRKTPIVVWRTTIARQSHPGAGAPIRRIQASQSLTSQIPGPTPGDLDQSTRNVSGSPEAFTTVKAWASW